jgi:hypothetical protein
MDFVIKNLNENVANIAREIGYLIIDSKGYNEYNMVRKLGYDNYPRFHIYLKQAGDKLIFNLHLDQKQPSYKGSHAHSGEYEGPVVESEADRIKQLLI